MFKVHKTEVEKQIDKKIKVIRSDLGGEFMVSMMKLVSIKVRYKLCLLMDL